MYKSMTGYGKAICDLPGKTLTIEIKSLNSKSMDLNMRMPSVYKEKELDMRNLISQSLERGKTDFSMYVENKPGYNQSRLNQAVILDFYRQFNELPFLENLNKEAVLAMIMRLPDTVELDKDVLSDDEWHLIEKEIVNAINMLNAFRVREGEILGKDILSRVDKILNLIPEVEQFEMERIEKVKARLNDQLKEFQYNNSIDKNRFEQELIFYLEKLDVTEEKVRLRAHAEYFHEVSALDEPSGKKLGFIVQEMGREINTLGSKANHQSIQRIVVEMKDELEKIKEQLLNVL
ncbi:MAG: YicC family protein [Bacteroidales bacterium]|nr:YicC family protein [Bacteroidales bacterium]